MPPSENVISQLATLFGCHSKALKAALLLCVLRWEGVFCSKELSLLQHEVEQAHVDNWQLVSVHEL